MLMLISFGGLNVSFASLVTPNSRHFTLFNTLEDTIKTSSDTELKSKVQCDARDSMPFDILGQKLRLYGNAKVKYEDVDVKAGYIEFDLGNNMVIAAGEKDSAGNIINKPELMDESGTISGDSIFYNTKTKKGLIKFLRTEQGGGFITTDVAKKDSNDVSYIKNGSYTTCNLEHPHFFIRMTKMKIIPNDKIVTGPAYLVIGDIPTPLAIPFGFFPNKKGRSSGIIIPAYGQSPGLGYYLKDGGYYFGLNDHYDLALKADVYSRGSWGLKALSNYNVRYKYSGNFALGYSTFKTSEKEFPDYSVRHDFNVRWSHRQDQKANPSVRFSSDVNILSSNYNKFNSNNTNDYLSNTFQSNIAWGKSWKRANLSTNLRHSQNTITHKMDMSLPQVAYSVNRFNPTKLFEKEGVIKSRWYDKIGVSYTADFENRISIRDTNIFKPTTNLMDSLQLGIKHTVPLSASYSNRFFSFSPQANFTSLWYFDKISKTYDAGDTLRTDTIKEFKTANFYTISLVTTSKLYGFYTFKNARVKAIRHVITPTVSFNYRPDFGAASLHYYETIYPNNSSTPLTYSIFQNGLYGSPPAGKVAGISFGLDNNLEMKVRPGKKDTATTDKKIVLIESFSINSSYNYAAEVFALAPFNIAARTRLYKNLISISGGALVDPYKIDHTGFRYNHYMMEDGVLGRLTSAQVSLTANLQSKTKKDDAMSKEKAKNDKVYEQQYNYAITHPEYYVDFNVPWNLNIGYNLRYDKPGIVETVTQSATFSGDVKVTDKWKVGFSSGWDLEKHDFTYTSLNVYRDLHCWEMTFNWVPFGFRKSYTININVKSSVLQDLKLSRKRDWYDYN